MSNKSKSISPESHSCYDLNVAFNTDTDTNQWIKLPEYTGSNRFRHTVVAYSDFLYVFGGLGESILADLILFSLKDKSWSIPCTTGTPPGSRFNHSAVVFGNSMFIYGGCEHYNSEVFGHGSQIATNSLYEYNFKSSQWVEWKFSNNTPMARMCHGAVVYDNKMWIFAGHNGNFALNDMWTLNLTGEIHTWEKVKQKGELPSPRYSFAVTEARDCMFIYFRESLRQISNSLYEFNFKTKTWRRIGNEHILRGVASQPPIKRYGHTMVHHDRFLYVFGGLKDSSLYCYDLDSQVWSIIEPEANSEVPCTKFHASAVIGDAMYIIGGINYDKSFKFRFLSHPNCTLREDYGKYLNEKQFCDIQFIVGPKEIKIMAHIAFVAARSKYLRTKILSAQTARRQQIEEVLDLGCIEKRTCSQVANQEPLLEVRLPDTNPETFEIILNYIYTDRIDLKEPYTNNIIILITDIYQLAGLFLMPRLAQLCIQYLNFKLNKENVLEALCNADDKKIQIVKNHCIYFLIKKENFNNVIMSNEFSNLDSTLLVEIIRRKSNSSKTKINNNREETVSTNLESDMAVFLESTGKDFYDIGLVLEGQVIMAHKSILSARSEYFRAMFRSFMPPNNTINISISDILPSVEALKSLLRYIYYGETKLPPQDALYLLQASEFYCLSNNRLYSFCKYSLEHNITYENVLETLEASDYTKILDIKAHALKLIVKDFARVVRLPNYWKLSKLDL